ncbi:hypothetical protein [Mycetocola zhadangensis]|uniref:hypothetical protein n=1 Tax=Mycetocola zhadangensis TaxID=1164595 RepID=UPI0016010CED|nr:hypothetical protein [Mycetocola zhadangensis]GGE99430.1 hypothetical protein GCM10011313_22980 [Mycetocola zhadangensis]
MSDTTNQPGPDSTIPDHETGLAAGYTGEPSSFEPEEDPDHSSDDANIEPGDKRIES